jgi:hypothetical protein
MEMAFDPFIGRVFFCARVKTPGLAWVGESGRGGN